MAFDELKQTQRTMWEAGPFERVEPNPRRHARGGRRAGGAASRRAIARHRLRHGRCCPSPFDWGKEDEVRRLLGDAFELEFERRDGTIAEPTVEAVWEIFSTSFGSLKTLLGTLEAARRDELHEAFVAFFDEYRTEDGIRQPRPYLIAHGTRR